MKCCGKEIKDFGTLFLDDTIDFKDRRVYTGRCSNDKCNAKIVEYIFYDVNKKRYDRFKPKRKDIETFLREIKINPYLRVQKDFKRGSKDNMNWYYQKNGNIYDFNDILKAKA